MKKCIILVAITLFMVIGLQSQVLKTQTVLYKLDLSDVYLMNQLDSILFINHPCTSKRGNVYMINIEESTLGYNINVFYTPPSIIEKDINTGIYINNNQTYIIRENSDRPLFSNTKKTEVFYYEKLVEPTGDKGQYLKEALFPYEPCMWLLIYANRKLKIQELYNVKKDCR
jgi:hypothetical protein